MRRTRCSSVSSQPYRSRHLAVGNGGQAACPAKLDLSAKGDQSESVSRIYSVLALLGATRLVLQAACGTVRHETPYRRRRLSHDPT